MVPEKYSATDIVFCYFGPFNALLLTPLTIQKIKILKKKMKKNPQKTSIAAVDPRYLKVEVTD